MLNIFMAEMDSKVASETFIKYVANNYLGMHQDELFIERNEYGKPAFVNLPDIHYNVSHTKGLIVCAVSDSGIGIDVERVRPFNRRIPERFFTRKEQEYIFINKEGQDVRFFEIWTKKEAYVKWLGRGMTVPLGSFDVTDDNRIVTAHDGRYVISICSNAFYEISADSYVKVIYNTKTSSNDK